MLEVEPTSQRDGSMTTGTGRNAPELEKIHLVDISKTKTDRVTNKNDFKS